MSSPSYQLTSLISLPLSYPPSFSCIPTSYKKYPKQSFKREKIGVVQLAVLTVVNPCSTVSQKNLNTVCRRQQHGARRSKSRSLQLDQKTHWRTASLIRFSQLVSSALARPDWLPGQRPTRTGPNSSWIDTRFRLPGGKASLRLTRQSNSLTGQDFRICICSIRLESC